MQENNDNLYPYLTVIMPVFNEQNTVEKVINKVIEQPIVGELLIINDGSTDQTSMILNKVKKNKFIKIISHKENRGKGAAIISSQANVTFPFIIIQDADLELNPNEYLKMLHHLIQDEADIVYGSRMNNSLNQFAKGRYLGNKFITYFSNIFTRLNLTDVATGYIAMKTTIFKQLKLYENGFSINAEITAKLALLNYRLVEVSVSYKPRTKLEGKKIKKRDAIRFAYCIVKYTILGRFKTWK
jgi:glycosyltransferase involved in cell wall biosynthesis